MRFETLRSVTSSPQIIVTHVTDVDDGLLFREADDTVAAANDDFDFEASVCDVSNNDDDVDALNNDVFVDFTPRLKPKQDLPKFQLQVRHPNHGSTKFFSLLYLHLTFLSNTIRLKFCKK